MTSGFNLLGDHKQMADRPPLDQARHALVHLLMRIRDHDYVGWYLGPGTQAFDLATEAYAAVTGRPLDELRREFAPRNPTDPRDGME